MDTKKLAASLSNIRTKIRTYQKQGKNVLYSAIFITGKQKEVLVDKAPTEQFSLITKNLKSDVPDKIKIELYDGKDSVNTIWIKEIKLNEPESEAKQSNSFQGFGEAEISRIVDDRFKERQRLEEYEQLKERVVELSDENEEYQDTIEKLENENERLEKIIDEKSQVRYYAGMLGDILEGIGISKDKIRNPIASLMGISESDKPNEDSPSSQPQNDTSGIVEDDETISPENKKRAEVLALMNDYLNSTDNQTLANLFTIFSEIESNPAKAIDIMTFIHSNK
jgi:FtsZ-binding cell division protein ZapB